MLAPLVEQNKNLLERRKSYMLPQIDKIICLLYKLEKNAGPDYFDAFKHVTLHKGEYLIREGCISKHLWFLESGLARIYSHKEGEEIIQYFFTPAELINAHRSSVHPPFKVNIQLLKDSEVIMISRSAWDRLAKVYPLIAQLEKIFTDEYVIWLENRIESFRNCNCYEKYLYVLHELAPIFNDISVTHIASYIGSSIETVSRARRSLASK